MIAAFVMALVALVVVVYTANQNIQRSIATSDWVNHTHAVMQEVDSILTSLHTGEAALRNYLITGDKRDQTAYRAAFNEMLGHIDLAKSLTRSPAERSQYNKTRKLEDAIAKRIQFTRELVQTAERDGMEGARRQLAADANGELQREIQFWAARLKEEQNEHLRARDKASYQQAEDTKWTIFSGVALNLVLTLFAGWLVRDDIIARRRAAQVLEEANAQLEIKVRERTAELAASNLALQKENLERRWSNQALQHQLHYSNLIIGSISDLVLVVSKAQNISRVNPAVVHATRYESPELVGSPLSKILELPATAPEGVPGTALFAQALKDGREIQDAVANIQRKDGRKIAARLSMIPLYDQTKVVGGVITVRLDPALKPSAG